MASPDGRYWIIYNGEIYNHIELREALRARGHDFASHSDTEVILAAFAEWGHDCLSRFNGMFAFVLLDRARKTLFAARDRFGVKPLYYWISPEGLIAFASEIKQFTVMPGWRPRLNGQRAYDFLNWGVSDHTDETLFEGVFQLRGGECVELDLGAGLQGVRPGGRLPVRRWYDLAPRPFVGTLPEAATEFRRLLTDSIRLRLRADVPVGSCLSGGLDSSSIVCLMSDLLCGQDAQALQKTFSACAHDERYDERRYVEEVVRHTAVAPHYVYPRVEELFARLDELTWHQDEPFGSSSIHAQWHVFRLAAENGVKVMLDGQGADEQLAGYDGYYGARYGGLLAAGRWLTLFREMRAARLLRGHSATWSLQQALDCVLPQRLRQPLRRLADRAAAEPDWLDMEKLGAVPADPLRGARAAGSTPLAALSRAQLTATSLPMLLHWEDRNSMAHSVEARVPFLDYRLVEFVLGLPDDYKIGDAITKRVLREGLRGVLPEPIRTRADKMGFTTPEQSWLRREGTPLYERALRESVEASAGAIKPAVLDIFNGVVDGRRRYTPLIWRLISFGAWVRIFGVRS